MSCTHRVSTTLLILSLLCGAQPTAAGDDGIEKVDIDPAAERKIGEESLESYLAHLKSQGVKVHTSGTEVDYLERLVDSVHPQMRNAKRYRSIHVLLADSPRIDARAFPGGALVFFQGLLDACESEAALVAVIGHELSHVDHGHQLRQARTFKLAERTFSGRGGTNRADFMTAIRGMAGLWAAPFRPEDEAVADEDGVTWAYRAGYDAREMAHLFEKLAAQSDRKSDRMPDFFRTHPRPGNRQRSVFAQFRKLERTEPRERHYVGRENLQRKITRAEQQFRE